MFLPSVCSSGLSNSGESQKRELAASNKPAPAHAESKLSVNDDSLPDGGSKNVASAAYPGARNSVSGNRPLNAKATSGNSSVMINQRHSMPTVNSLVRPQIILPKTSASSSTTLSGSIKFSVPIASSNSSVTSPNPNLNTSLNASVIDSRLVSIPVLQFGQPAVTQNRMTFTFSGNDQHSIIRPNQAKNRQANSVPQNRMLIKTTSETTATPKQHFALNGSSSRFITGVDGATPSLKLTHSPVPLNLTKVTVNGMQNTPNVTPSEPLNLTLSKAVTQRAPNTGPRKVLRKSALSNGHRSPVSPSCADIKIDLTKECVLCSRKSDADGAKWFYREYAYYESLTIRQRDRDPSANNSKLRNSTGNTFDDKNSNKNGEKLQLERSERIERRAYVCGACEKQFHSIMDVNSLAPCACDDRVGRRTRTADACDGHRATCSRYRFEKLRELRKKHAEWSREQINKSIAAASAAKTKKLTDIRSGPGPQPQVRTSTGEPQSKLLKLAPSTSNQNQAQSQPKAGAADPRSPTSSGIRRLVPIQPKRHTSLSPPCVFTSPRKDVSDGTSSFRVLTVGGNVVSGSGAGASAGTQPEVKKTAVGRPSWPQTGASTHIAIKLEAKSPPRSTSAGHQATNPDKRQIESIKPNVVDARSHVRNTLANTVQQRVAIVRPSITTVLPVNANNSMRIVTKPQPSAPVRTTIRYDKSRMRPVAKFLFNLGLDLVQDFVTRSDERTKTQTSNLSNTVTAAAPNESNAKEIQPPPEDGADIRVDIADQNGDATDPVEITKPSEQTIPDKSASSAVLATETEAETGVPSESLIKRLQVSYLNNSGAYRCKYCGFVTQSQLVYARHKLTGWIRWVNEADAREIERRKGSRRMSRPKRRKPRRSAQRDDAYSEGSNNYRNSSSDSDANSDSSREGTGRKRRQPTTVQLVSQGKEASKHQVPHYASEWSIGEEPPDVFIGQCCTCGFIATRHPFAYTAHLLTKHNISLTVDEATLSVARCPFCPYTLRNRNAAFKHHVNRCALRFNAASNLTPPSFVEELPVILRGRQGPLLYEMLGDAEAVSRLLTGAPARSGPDQQKEPPASSMKSIDKVLDSVVQASHETSRSLPQRSSADANGPEAASNGELTSIAKSSAVNEGDLRERPPPRSRPSSPTADAVSDDCIYDTDSPMDAGWIERNLNMVATSKLADYVAARTKPKIIQQQKPAADVNNDFCAFCDKNIKAGTDPRYHFTGGHLVAVRVQIRSCKCPFCNVPYSPTAPAICYENVNQLHEHILVDHKSVLDRKSSWWPHIVAALRACGSTLRNTEDDLEVNPNLVKKVKVASRKSEPANLAASSSANNGGTFCPFCSTSFPPTVNCFEHFNEQHLCSVRTSIHKFICPMCGLPEKPGTATMRKVLQFASVAKLYEHVECVHRIEYRLEPPFWWPFVQIEVRRAFRSSTKANKLDVPTVTKQADNHKSPSKEKSPELAPKRNGAVSTDTNTFCVFCAKQVPSGDTYMHFSTEHLVLLGIQIGKLECPLCNLFFHDSPAATRRFDEVAELSDHVSAEHGGYRYSYWWPYLSTALDTAAKSSHPRILSNSAVSSTPASRKRSAEEKNGEVNSAIAAKKRRTEGTYCPFCDKVVYVDIFYHFSGAHLSFARKSLRAGGCPFPECSENPNSATHAFTDAAELKEHCESVHGEYKEASWWSFIASTFRSVQFEQFLRSQKGASGSDVEGKDAHE